MIYCRRERPICFYGDWSRNLVGTKRKTCPHTTLDELLLAILCNDDIDMMKILRSPEYRLVTELWWILECLNDAYSFCWWTLREHPNAHWIRKAQDWARRNANEQKKTEKRILYRTMRWQRLCAFRFSNLINRCNYCCFVCCDACTYAREWKFIDVQIISVALIINLSFQTNDDFFLLVLGVFCMQTISKSYTFW